MTLNCSGKEYDFVGAVDFMLHLETSLEPSVLKMLKANGVEPVHLAHKLWSVVPNIISLSLNTSASENAMKATMVDLITAVMSAKTLPIGENFEAWLKSRQETEKIVLEQVLQQNGTIRGTQRGRMLQKVERADEMIEELRQSREDVRRLLTKIEKQDAKIERLEQGF